MRSATGRWVSGNDFFDRESELHVLEQRVRDGNHVLLTGQRRMGKTSLVRELGRRLTEGGGWAALYTDVEDATRPEDVVAEIAREAYRVCRIVSIRSGLANVAGRAVGAVEELGVSGFRLKIRAALSAGNWRRFGSNAVEVLEVAADVGKRIDADIHSHAIASGYPGDARGERSDP